MLHPQAPEDQQENVLDVFLHRPSGNELWPLLMLHVTARTARRAPKADIRQRVNIVQLQSGAVYLLAHIMIGEEV
jgi:hypothetical protein